uniref:Uncharacterized protein n=1 Tax=Gopherus agassizii TaxID=38772 RepID=A0A452HZN6_9SAUR
MNECNELITLGQSDVSLTVFALLFDFLKRRKSWSRYPPGPTSLPFIGTMLQIDFHNPHLSFTQLSRKYGNVFSLQNCWNNLIVVNGFKADFADRPYGQAWKEQRRFALSTLRNFGMGKKSLEQRVTEDAGFLCSAICSEKGLPFDPHFLINNAVSNVICSLICGERFDYDNKKFQRLLHLVEQTFNEEAGFLPQLLIVVPWLLHIPGVPWSIFRSQKEVLYFTDELVKEHRTTWNLTQKRDFTNAFLQEIEKVGGEQQV